MQLARIAEFIAAVKVIYPVGGVGVLLNFTNHNTCADCMNCAGFYEEHITLFHFNSVKNLCDSIIFDSFKELVL